MKKMLRLVLCLTMLMASSVVAEPKSVKLNFNVDDIEYVHIEGSRVAIRLAEKPTIKLLAITAENIGRSLELTIGDIPALHVTIHTKVDSGVIVVSVASDQLLDLLKPLSVAYNKSK